MVADVNDEYACAAIRSMGSPACPRRVSSRPTVSIRTSDAASASTLTSPPAIADPSCSPRRRFIGVKRQFSSRPPGTSKASTSYPVKRSAREAAGTIDSAAAGIFEGTVLPATVLAADRSFHLPFVQAVHPQRVLHRQLLRDR